MVQDYMSQLENKRGPKDRRSPRRTAHPANHCTATSDIPAATDLDTPGTGTATILRRNDEDGLTDSLLEIDVVNRNPNLSIAEGEYFRVEHIFSEWVPHGGGGSSVPTVRFRIVAAGGACVNCFAQALVISGPVGSSSGDALPGSTYDEDAQYYTIDVYDMGEGWLNHPPDELLNMIGHATWLRSYEDGPCAEPPGAKWEIISLQCPEEAVCD
jgi:hypothetical protein